ncbi:MAG: HNH endonuclease, partial [Mycobacterium sp.]|nr:HNH endonuclease [Mycobacterium sp.]
RSASAISTVETAPTNSEFTSAPVVMPRDPSLSRTYTDHLTPPWARGGPTHPSNLALLCRPHHLLKTFWIGEKGWREEQSADGTIVWTSPSGCVYTTEPGCTLFFPELAVPSTVLTYAVGQPDSGSRPDSYSRRSLMMPTRRRSRAADRAARVKFERGLNEARWAADPPPF